MTTEVVILAAGQGSRMQSKLPKVLHRLAGKPMLAHVIESAQAIEAENIHVVIGHGAEQVKSEFQQADVHWVQQQEQLGTGHAVAQALPGLSDSAKVLIAYGDVPLVAPTTLAALAAASGEQSLSLLTVKLDNPTGYGRIVRDNQNKVVAIVEQKDASTEQLAINEVNTGILAVSAKKLREWLPKLSASNAQGEYYLTDIIEMAVADGMLVIAQHPDSDWEVQGVNNRKQLNELERYYQQLQAERLMLAGASIADPARLDVRGKLTTGKDVYIDVNCIFIGDVTLGNDVEIGPNCIISDSTLADGCVVKANSVIEGSQLDKACEIGPYARLRPGTTLADSVKIGNFVETKKAVIDKGSKVNHLSYVGDSRIGKGVNIGAGTITCNYDGVNKHLTEIGDDAFIGSNTALVAPVKIGDGATVAAGTTVTSNVANGQLTVARAKQRNIDNWQRPKKS